MFLVYEMEYLHPVNDKTSIQMIPFSSKYQEEYKRIYNQCYHEMRQSLKIEPFDFIQIIHFLNQVWIKSFYCCAMKK